MESERNPCHFWLGIESETDAAEWEALVRRRLENRQADPPLLIAEIIRPETSQPAQRIKVRAG